MNLIPRVRKEQGYTEQQDGEQRGESVQDAELPHQHLERGLQLQRGAVRNQEANRHHIASTQEYLLFLSALEQTNKPYQLLTILQFLPGQFLP